METATFGAGCFWQVEAHFKKQNGVLSTRVGYSGGTVENPTYKQVCTGETGHAEVLQLQYDSNVISYQQLLDIFWSMHDPTTLNRQGPDIGTQYRSVIYYHSPEQKMWAEERKKRLDESQAFSDPVVTEISRAAPFYEAEECHQCYFEKQESQTL